MWRSGTLFFLLFFLGLLVQNTPLFAQKNKKRVPGTPVQSIQAVPDTLEPDADNDGTPDRLDECILDPGRREMKGCPDTDFDGIINKHDSCPDVKGVAGAKGCPDRDADGLPDDDDDCPDVYAATRTGCPPPPVESLAPEQLEIVPLRNFVIYYALAQSEIQETHVAVIDSLLTQLHERPELYVEIEGHTDNIGTSERNLALSQVRADICKDYLLERGIGARRIRSSKGFGDVSPKGSNETEAGRAQNRRTEFHLIILKAKYEER